MRIGLLAIFWGIMILCLFPSCSKTDLNPLEFFEVRTGEFAPIELGLLDLKGEVFGLDQQLDSIEVGFIYSAEKNTFQLGDVDEQTVKKSSGILNFPAPGNSFIQQIQVSSIDSTYFFRAYAKKGKREVYGDFKTFSFDLKVLTSNKTERNNDQITLDGFILGLEELRSEISQHGHVFSQTEPLPEFQLDDTLSTTYLGSTRNNGSFKSIVNNLEFHKKYFARAYIIVNEERIYSEPIEFCLEEGWKKQNLINNEMSFSIRGIQGAFSCVDPNQAKAFIGYGCDQDCQFDHVSIFSHLGSFTPRSNSESVDYEILDNMQPLFRANAVAVFINGKVYFGLGDLFDDRDIFEDFWEYDPASGDFRPMKSYPGGPRTKAVAFSIGEVAYIGTGVNQSQFPTNDFYRFHPPDIDNPIGSWDTIQPLMNNCERVNTTIATMGRSDAIAFTKRGVGYVGTGRTTTCINHDIYRYDEENDDWIFVTMLPDTMPLRFGAIAFSIEDQFFIGTGRNNSEAFNDLWEFREDGTCIKRTALPADGRSDAIGFSINDKGFLGTGWFSRTGQTTPVYNDFWTYYPMIEN